MPAPSQYRSIDYLFFGYFLLQIIGTLLFDSQGVYSEWLYPSWLKSVRKHYLESYRDPFLADAWKHPWYLSVCLVEHFILMPFFFWATECYYHGARARPQIIVPALMYSVHTLTAVTAIWFMALSQDFSQYQDLAPRSFAERLVLCSAYLPFFLVSFINVVDSFRLAWKVKLD